MSFLRFPTIGKPKDVKRKRQYDPQLLSLAFNEVKKGMKIHKASVKYGIPDSTLRDRFSGPMQPAPEPERFNTRPGPQPVLSDVEEQQLVDHTKYMSSIGYGYSRAEFMTLATDYAKILQKKGPSDPEFSQSWYDGFITRHADLTLAKPQKLSLVRARATSEAVLDAYFKELDSVLKKHGLMDKPENIWNVDESGLLMEHRPTNVLCEKGSVPQAVTSSRGQTVTIIAAGSAVGNRVPPYYIFPGKRWKSDFLDGACPGSAGTMSDSGWSNSLIFLDYLKMHFSKYVPASNEPVLLMFDGHKSHVNMTLKEWGESRNLVFFVIPPHTSHITQPLDVGCFGPMKRAYHSECQAYMRRTPGLQINKLNIAELSGKAYNKAVTPANLIAAFKKSGIYPINRDQLTPSQTAPSAIYQEVVNEVDTTEENTTGTENEKELSFLDKRKITKVLQVQKKRKVPPAVHGNLMSPTKSSKLKRPSESTLQIKPENENKSSSKKSVKSSKHVEKKSPLPGTSGLNLKTTSGIPVDTDSDSDSYVEDDETDKCVVCKKSSPDAFTCAYTIEIIKWGRCDSCSGWVHLKYCTPVRVLRRGDTFICPLCDREP
ncbi:uncharacterized protein LOC123564232 [Mercenaria mercenaria]|uniref:uncharacterized protein LOC123564232 n=1 Tax=Mercenaria mercenaria TaxID=6596 RepID=UPI001E1D9B7D|nr:uncharacterized protein LOC123564232 [Mercenaria mercenaria]